MKKILLLFIAVSALSFRAGSPVRTITEKERMVLVTDLRQTKAFYEKTIAGLTTAQAVFKPAADKWSILQCMEHIAAAESGIMGYIKQILTTPGDSTKKAEVKVTDEQVLAMTPDRSSKFKAPEFLQPIGKFKSIDSASLAFLKARDENIKFAETTQDDLRNHFILHPFLGMMDTYQWLLMLSAHSRRHTLQIEEVKATAGFPK